MVHIKLFQGDKNSVPYSHGECKQWKTCICDALIKMPFVIATVYVHCTSIPSISGCSSNENIYQTFTMPDNECQLCVLYVVYDRKCIQLCNSKYWCELIDANLRHNFHSLMLRKLFHARHQTLHFDPQTFYLNWAFE